MIHPTRAQLPNLTTLRFFAALSVFLHHVDAIGLRPSRWLWDLNLGWTVSFFFVLSGFVLAYSYSGRLTDSSAVRAYMLQRAARLWPVHLACLLMLAILVGVDVASPIHVLLPIALLNAWYPAYGSGFALNSVSWSISVEIFFYALLPFLIRLSNARLIALFAANALFVAALIVFFSKINPPSLETVDPFWFQSMVPTANSVLLFFPPVRLIEFLAGVLAYRAFAASQIPARWVGTVQFLMLVGLVGYMTQHSAIVHSVAEHVSSAAAQAYKQFGAFPLFAAIIFVFAHQAGRISKMVSWRPLVFLGDVSFAFYMVHQIVLRFVAQYWAPSALQEQILAAALSFGISLGLASLLAFAVEKPVLAWVKGINRRTTQMPRPVRRATARATG